MRYSKPSPAVESMPKACSNSSRDPTVVSKELDYKSRMDHALSLGGFPFHLLGSFKGNTWGSFKGGLGLI